MDLAYQEYLDLVQENRAPELAAFCAKFPGLEESLAGLLQFHHQVDAWAEELGPEGWPLAVAQPTGYRDLELIAHGPLSSVYLAREDDAEGQAVILKLSKMGAAEASVHAGLDRKRHANIAGFILYQQIQEGWTLAVMPYQGNLTLADLLQQLERARGKQRPRAVLQAALEGSSRVWGEVVGTPKPCPKVGDYQEEVLTWAEKLASALEVVHEKYAHGDIKPANVLLKPEGEPLLLDFNLARKPEGSALPPGGTLLYMAPELLEAFETQAGERRRLDYQRADQYAFGVMLIQLLTGRHPYAPGPMPKGSTRELAQVLRRAMDDPAARSWDRFGVLDRGLRQLLRRCVVVEPGERWTSFGELRGELQRWRSRRTRNRWLLIAASVCLAVTAAATWPVLASALEEPVTPASVRRTLERGELQRAFEEATQLVSLGTDRAEGYYLRALALERLGNPQSAIAELQASLREREIPERRALLGYYYGLPEINDGPSLRRECLRAQSLGYETAANCNNLGLGYLKLSVYSESLKCLNQAITLDAGLATAYRNRARCHLALATVRNGDPQRFMPLALQDVAVALSSLSGNEFHFEAASAYAAAAKREPIHSEAMLRQVKLAVQEGLPSKRFEDDANFRAFLTSSDFQQVLATPPLATPTLSSPRVVRPHLPE